MKTLDALLATGVQNKIFPLARAEIFYAGRRVYSGGNATEKTVFDVASLTKVVCTTALCIRLNLFGPIHNWLPNAAANVDTLDLLYHRSGLPAFLPLFVREFETHPELCESICPSSIRQTVRRSVISRALAIAPERSRGQLAVYSDVGFILLGVALEIASNGRQLDALFTENVAKPLGLSANFRRLSLHLPVPKYLADTGCTRPREPAPGQEDLWTTNMRASRRGEVDDDNAFCLDGVAGHSGLFATAYDIATFGQAVLEGRVLPPEFRQADTLTLGSTRACGFDTPGDKRPSCGPRFGRKARGGAIGHLGFTGTSLWIDFDRELVVALLTNRIALGRSNLHIQEFRPHFHEAVLDELNLA